MVDATGSAKSMIAAYHFVGFAGRLVWVGITQDQLAFTQPLMHRREMTFLASRNALPPEFTRIIRLIEGGMIDTRPWITHRAPFDAMIGRVPELAEARDRRGEGDGRGELEAVIQWHRRLACE